MTGLRLEALSKRFGPSRAPVRALDSITLAVAASEFLTVVGPSGSGKTTLLRAVAGLERLDAGRVWFGDRDVTRLEPESRNAGVVFAHGALYPHRTVAANLAYGPKVHGMRAEQRTARVREVARALRLDDLLQRLPTQLSSGQAQRVALGRALANAPEVLLLDEPLSRLDAPLRAEIREELRRAHRQFETTTLCVTHDQAEALALGDRVAVLAGGKLLQIGSPRDVYDRPACAFVAAFFGTPAPARLEGRIDAGTFVGRSGSPRLELGFACAAMPRAALFLRSEALALIGPEAAAADLRGVVREVEDAGADVLVYVDWSDGTLVLRTTPPGPARGQVVGISVKPERVLAFNLDSDVPLYLGTHV